MALSTRRKDRSYPTPMKPGFDDSNREQYIARSSGIGSLAPRAGTIVDYNLGRGGRDPSMIGGFGLGPINPVIEVPTDDKRIEDILGDILDNPFDAQPFETPPMERPILPIPFETPPMERPILPKDFVPEFIPAGLLGPGPGLGDPTGEGGIIQRLGEMLGLTPRTDPENEGLPMDEFQDAPMIETLEASADTYTLPNLLQMLNDARDAGNEDEIELLTNDLEMMYPGAMMNI
jgi:hypothetical protein